MFLTGVIQQQILFCIHHVKGALAQGDGSPGENNLRRQLSWETLIFGDSSVVRGDNN